MSSGSYFPPPVRAVEIEKPHGEGMRTLGIPTVADRIAQTVVARHLEERVEPVFHPDSYGYRPGRSAHDAVETARRRCWQYDWVIDLDIRAFFDTVPLGARPGRGRGAHRCRLGAAVRPAVAGRPAAAPGRDEDRAGPGNSAGVSGLAGAGEPVPALRTRRLADPRAPRCGVRALRRRRAGALPDPRPGPGGAGRDRAAATRPGDGRAPGQTTIVYCRDGKRRGRFPVVSFTVLGFMFCPRPSRNHRGEQFLAFLPAISPQALTKIGRVV